MTTADVQTHARLKTKENVARYVGGSHVDSNTGKINGSAFDRTQKDVDGLSFTRTEFFAKDQNVDDAEIRKIVGSCITLRKSACFAEINAGRAIMTLSDFDQNFYFVAAPEPAVGKSLPNLAHSLLIGLPFVGEVVGSLNSELAGDLLKRQIQRTFPAVLK